MANGTTTTLFDSNNASYLQVTLADQRFTVDYGGDLVSGRYANLMVNSSRISDAGLYGCVDYVILRDVAATPAVDIAVNQRAAQLVVLSK